MGVALPIGKMSIFRGGEGQDSHFLFIKPVQSEEDKTKDNIFIYI